MKRFESCHPIFLMSYFVAVLILTMFNAHPVITGISLIFALSFFFMLTGFNKGIKSVLWAIPLMLVMALTNPVFVHKGETILFFLNDNPVTLEAVFYGINASLTITAVYYWFQCYHAVMTSDKFVYLFGRVAPKLSLMLSLVLNFVPQFKKHYKEIDAAQKAMGVYSGNGYTERVRHKFRVISALVSLSLENGVTTADSMKARGYGLPGRTAYADFKWRRRDSAVSVVCLICCAAIIFGYASGGCAFVFYPTTSAITFSVFDITTYGGAVFLSAVPTFMEIKENILWHYLKSKI